MPTKLHRYKNKRILLSGALGAKGGNITKQLEDRSDTMNAQHRVRGKETL
jgi:hypothetical protein